MNSCIMEFGSRHRLYDESIIDSFGRTESAGLIAGFWVAMSVAGLIIGNLL